MTARSETTGILLAGGLGTRLKQSGVNVPKPFISCCGKPFLEWVLSYFREQGVSRFTISLGFQSDHGLEHFRIRPPDGLEIHCVCETAQLGTGGAVLFAWDATPGNDVIASNGDSLVVADLSVAWEWMADPAVDGVLVGVWQADASRFGTLEFDDRHRLIRFAEKQPGEGVINSGIYLLKSRLRNLWPRRTPLSVEHEVFPELIAKGCELRVAVVDADMLDIGTPESLQQAPDFIRRHFASSDQT